MVCLDISIPFIATTQMLIFRAVKLAINLCLASDHRNTWLFLGNCDGLGSNTPEHSLKMCVSSGISLGPCTSLGLGYGGVSLWVCLQG